MYSIDADESMLCLNKILENGYQCPYHDCGHFFDTPDKRKGIDCCPYCGRKIKTEGGKVWKV